MRNKLLQETLLQIFSVCMFLAIWGLWMQAQDSTSPLRLQLAEWQDDWNEIKFRRRARRIQRDLDTFERTVNGG